MALGDFIGEVVAGRGGAAISREANRVAGNVSREVDRVGQSVGREADRVAGGVEDAAAYVRREANRAVSNAAKLGKKVDDGIHAAANLGKKYSGAINSVARKVETGADIAAGVLGGAAALAAGTGVGAPIAAGLGAAAGAVKAVGEGAEAVAKGTAVVNRGIARAENMGRVGTKMMMGGVSQGANTLNRGLDLAEMRTGAMRSGIERVRKSASGSVPRMIGGLGTL